MNDFNVSITTTTRRRKLTGGKVALYDQYYCEYRDPYLERPRHAGQFAAALADRWPSLGAVHLAM